MFSIVSPKGIAEHLRTARSAEKQPSRPVAYQREALLYCCAEAAEHRFAELFAGCVTVPSTAEQRFGATEARSAGKLPT